MPICPMCEEEIDIEEKDLEKGDEIDCPECYAALFVVSKSPIVLSEQMDIEEEDEEDEEDDNEYDVDYDYEDYD